MPRCHYGHTFQKKREKDTHTSLWRTRTANPKILLLSSSSFFAAAAFVGWPLFLLLLLRFHFYLSGISRGTTGTHRSPVYERIRQLLLLREEEKIFSFLPSSWMCVCAMQSGSDWLGWSLGWVGLAERGRGERVRPSKRRHGKGEGKGGIT